MTAGGVERLYLRRTRAAHSWSHPGCSKRARPDERYCDGSDCQRGRKQAIEFDPAVRGGRSGFQKSGNRRSKPTRICQDLLISEYQDTDGCLVTGVNCEQCSWNGKEDKVKGLS